MIFRPLAALFLFVLTVCDLGANAQDREVDSKLLAKFSQKDVEAMNNETLAYWNFFVNDGFQVFEISKEKSESELEMIDYSGAIEDMNPLSLGLLPEPTSVKTYRLGNTGHGIMILSEKKIRAKMERISK